QKIDETHLITLLIGIGGIVVIKGAKKIHNNIPGALIAVAAGTAIVYFFQLHGAGVNIVESIPEGLPSFQWPQFELGKISELIPLALTISVVAFMEAFSVAKAIEAKQKNHKVIANQELIGLGAANLIGSLFQSYPVTGGFSRSAVNHQSGAHTPLASIFSATLIGLTLLFLTPLFYYLPTAILASVIMVAVAGLIDFRYVKKLWRENKIEFGLLMVTFFATITFGMVPGIVSGVVLSILILLYRAAYPHIAQLGRLKGQSEFRNIKRFRDLEVWDNRAILRIDAPLTFINIQNIKDYIEALLEENDKIKQVILDASAVSQIDASAAQGISDLLGTFQEKNIQLLLSDVIGPVRDTLHRTGLLGIIGEENIYLTLNDAVNASPDGDYQYRDLALQHGVAIKNKI
ncbi:MAG: SulP family inorganic anion transporter, partial [Bacteroidota bacterium]